MYVQKILHSLHFCGVFFTCPYHFENMNLNQIINYKCQDLTFIIIESIFAIFFICKDSCALLLKSQGLVKGNLTLHVLV